MRCGRWLLLWLLNFGRRRFYLFLLRFDDRFSNSIGLLRGLRRLHDWRLHQDSWLVDRGSNSGISGMSCDFTPRLQHGNNLCRL